MLSSVVSMFAAASNELIARRELLRRMDSKYTVHLSAIPALIGALSRDYAVLGLEFGGIATYESLYLDSPDLRCFHDHRRGRRVRHKIRYRHYPDRQLSFLEVKTKRNEMLTDKYRLAIPYRLEHRGEHERAFLRDHVGALGDELVRTVYVNYRRVSLIGIETNERITIDFDLDLATPAGEHRSFGTMAVIEVKQSPFSLATPAMRAFAAAGLRPRSMSKYVIAIAMIRPEQRRNRFLPHLRGLERNK